MLVSLNNDRPVTAAGSVAAPPIEQNARSRAVGAPAPVRSSGVVAKDPAPSRGELEDAVKTLNQFTEMAAQDVRFSIDEESGKTIVKVVDVATQAVLRQIPNVEALSISRSLNKMQGLLVRDSA